MHPTTTLQQALVSRLVEHYGNIAHIRQRLHDGNLTRVTLRAYAEGLLPQDIARADMRARIIDFALDELASERLSPEVRLASQPITLPELSVYALVFSAFPHIANEIYPLLVDAYVAGLEQRTPAFQVVGVHESWLCEGSFRRAILFTEDDQGLIEADVDDAPLIRSAQVLALDLREEQAAHWRIAEALSGVPLVNPYAGAVKLDDKAWTGACWQRAGLVTPDFTVMRVQTPDDIMATSFATYGLPLVVKPVGGTEGRAVALANSVDEALAAVQDAAHFGGVLIERAHGTLRYADEAGPVRCTVRLNICWDGTRAIAESGYAQIAATSDGIASAGRGGRIVPLYELWAKLCREDNSQFKPARADWQRLLESATAGVTALAGELGEDMPRLVGIDLLLDLDACGAIKPVLLEANGRPAGMSHSRFINPEAPTDEPGVTMALWRSF